MNKNMLKTMPTRRLLTGSIPSNKLFAVFVYLV